MARHRLNVTLRWEDFDAISHVNNTSFLEFMQDARISLIHEFGLDKSSLQNVGHFVARNEIDYLKPVFMDDRYVTVELWVSHFGGASYHVSYDILNQSGEICAKATSVMVTVDVATGTTIRIPDDVREAMSRFAEV